MTKTKVLTGGLKVISDAHNNVWKVLMCSVRTLAVKVEGRLFLFSSIRREISSQIIKFL